MGARDGGRNETEWMEWTTKALSTFPLLCGSRCSCRRQWRWWRMLVVPLKAHSWVRKILRGDEGIENNNNKERFRGWMREEEVELLSYYHQFNVKCRVFFTTNTHIYLFVPRHHHHHRNWIYSAAGWHIMSGIYRRREILPIEEERMRICPKSRTFT